MKDSEYIECAKARVNVEEGMKTLFNVPKDATRSICHLKGLFLDNHRKPVSVEEMNATIAKRAAEYQ